MKRKNLSKKKRLKKLLSTSATGLVLLSTLTQPVVSLANTVEETKESEKKTVSSNEQSPIENPVNALEKTISSSSNTEATVEKADQTVETKEANKQEVEETKESEEKTQQEVQGRAVTPDVIQYLMETKIYTDANLTTVRPTLMQADIDSVRAEIQKLPDGETKTQYLSKLDQAFNQLQEFTLRSDVGETFATVNVTPNKLILRTTGRRPSSYGTFLVSQLKIIRGGREILRRDILANDNLSVEQLEYTLQNGDKVEIFIHDPLDGVLMNHDKLNPNHNNNSLLNFVARYTIVDGLLVLQDKYNEIVNTVRSLYEDNNQTIVKKTLLQSEIDNAREKVNALPDGEEKTRLLSKVDQAYNGLQEIQLKGYNNRLFARLTVTNGKLLFHTEEGRPHQYFEQDYAVVEINRREGRFRLPFYGNEVYPQETREFNIQDGDTITIMKKEADGRYLVNHPELKPNNSGNYTYVVQDGMLIEASRKIQLDAQNAVKGLYEDEAQTIVKKDLLQENVDAAREKVNALPDGEEKTRLLSKVDQAFNGLQEIQLRGGYSTLFSRITVTNGKLLVRTSEGVPHFNWRRVYATIQVTRGEESIYSREYVGTTSYQKETQEVDLQNGDIVTVTKEEATEQRMIVNHPELKPNNNGTYTYVVQDGLLIEASRKVQLDAQNAVKGLYEDEEQTIVKKDLIQETIDEAREKVNALPDSEEKTRLVEKIDQAFNGLQEIQLRGGYSTLFSRITVTNGKLLVRTSEGVPHFNWRRVYATIQVTRGEESIYSREYVGTTSYQKETEEVELQNGDIVTVTKEEATEQRMIVNHSELKPNTSGNYTYLVQDGLLVDQTVAFTEANTAVNNLFEGEEPKESNTQEQINEAKEKVNALLDSSLKQQLLAKIEYAQEKLKEHAAITAVNNLFEGEEPKDTNTQEQIDAAREKVNVLPESSLKQQLLAKIEQAQEKLDSFIGTVTAQDYRLGGTDNYVRGTVTGNVEYLRLEVNGTLYAKSTVKDSDYAYYALDKVKKANDQVYIVAYNPADKEIARQQVNIIAAQGELTVQPYVLNGTDRYIRGTVSGEIDHIRLRVNDQLYAKSTIKGNTFQYFASDKINSATDKVELVAYDRLGNIITEQSVVINEITTTLSVNKFVLGGSDRYIRGTYTGNISYLRLEVNGTLYAKAGVKGSSFQYYAVDKIKNVNDQVTLIAYNENDQEVTRQTVTLEQTVTGTVTPLAYILGGTDRYVRGTYTGSVDHLRLEVNGKLYAKSTVTGNTFQYYAVDKITKASDNVNIIAYDANGIELAKEKVTIKETQPITLTTQKYTIGGADKYIRGTYKGLVDHFRLEVNGQLHAKSTAKGSPYQYYAVDKITNKNDQVYMIAYDANGKELAKEKVTLETVNQGSITVDPYVINGGDNYLHGEYTGEINHLRLEVGGKLYAKATVKSSPFRYYAVDKIKNTSDQVYIIGYDSDGVELDRQLVEVKNK
ncbi:immunoglobulin-like domain-containing protein [Enterococcus villorum]|uniref:immunoglobulin-like domain-containing protein n=1 Tax=Enterococcus villorum TaxID=112904 RepID=UPI003F8B99CA